MAVGLNDDNNGTFGMAWKNDGVNGKGHNWYGKGENETQAIFGFFLKSR